MAKKLWGGRFKKELDPELLRFSSSISYDKRLAAYDIAGSIAHSKMLGKCGVISKKDSSKLAAGLAKISKKVINADASKYEDIHSAVTDLLKKEIGETAGKLHTARSRNDQIALDVRMYCKKELGDMIEATNSLQKCILAGAKKFSGKNTTMPSYTHMQQAQCILLSHQLLAYIEMLERDKQRMIDAYKRTDVMPLGSSANRGTRLPIDRFYVAKMLGFSKVSDNSIDSVSDRDFIIEILSALAILAMHMSRIAEDFIIWSSDEFKYVEGDDAHYTGSSMMPNKKNPDMLELIRGYSGQVYGGLLSILVTMKGLPLTYNRDMQLDKLPLFNAVDIVKCSLPVLEKVLYGMRVNDIILKVNSITNEYIFATDICEYLIEKGYNQARAHEIAGKIVLYSLENGVEIKNISDAKLSQFSKQLNRKTVKKLLDPVESVKSVKSYGGTSPSSVKRQINKWEKILK